MKRSHSSLDLFRCFFLPNTTPGSRTRPLRSRKQFVIRNNIWAFTWTVSIFQIPTTGIREDRNTPEVPCCARSGLIYEWMLLLPATNEIKSEWKLHHLSWFLVTGHADVISVRKRVWKLSSRGCPSDEATGGPWTRMMVYCGYWKVYL